MESQPKTHAAFSIEQDANKIPDILPVTTIWLSHHCLCVGHNLLKDCIFVLASCQALLRELTDASGEHIATQLKVPSSSSQICL